MWTKRRSKKKKRRMRGDVGKVWQGCTLLLERLRRPLAELGEERAVLACMEVMAWGVCWPQ